MRSVLVYSGINVVSDDRLFLFEDVKSKYNSEDDEYVDFQLCNLTRIHDWLTGADAGIGVPQVELTVLNPSWTRSPYETVLGLMPLKDLARLYADHGRALVAANIRYYKGKTDVNAQIMRTMREEPEHFFYLNNGLTAYCDRLTVHNLDRTKAESKRITAKGFSIVNGAQTLGSIAECLKCESAEALSETLSGSVFIKVISLERCEDERKFAERITRSTNFQNQIGSRDFVALDEQQARIANELTLSGITYHYKDDAEMPELDAHNFDLKEATTASACLANEPDLCARILSKRASLWSMGEDYPGEERPSRYERVFREDRSARMVWRAVQAQRLHVRMMRDCGKAETGVRKDFFENARWVLLNAVFVKVKPQYGEQMWLSADEEKAVVEKGRAISDLLWAVCGDQGYVLQQTLTTGEKRFESPRHFRSVFSSAADCRKLRGLLLAKLAKIV
ncbi:MAG: AIPR family protein [Cyanobacteria bacterium J06649_4]